jgi:hypothetical protein
LTLLRGSHPNVRNTGVRWGPRAAPTKPMIVTELIGKT